jgi:predicted RNA polymerase sigma factor
MEGDDALALIFMCCHPQLTPASAIALALPEQQYLLTQAARLRQGLKEIS